MLGTRPSPSPSPGTRTRLATLTFLPLLAVVGLVVLGLAVLAAPLVEAGDDEREGPSYADLKKLVKQGVRAADEDKLEQLLNKLANMKGRDAARAVLSVAMALPPDEEQYYWYMLGGVSGFRSPEASSEMGEFIIKHRNKAVARDLMSALQQQGRKHRYMNRIVRRVLQWCDLDLQLMAIDLCAQIPVRRSVDVLMPFYAKLEELEKDRALPSRLKQRVIHALEGLTLHDFGNSYPNWKGWWGAHRHKGLKIIRLDAEHDDPMTGVIQKMDPVRAREFAAESIPPGKVLVIKAPNKNFGGGDMNFDHIERVLSRLKVPHVIVEKTRVAERDFDLRKYAAIFINCSQIHQLCDHPGATGNQAVGNRLYRCTGPAPHTKSHFGWWCGEDYKNEPPRAKVCRENRCGRDHPAIKKLKAWVKAGGFLFTEDWILIEVLESAFPKFVARGQKIRDPTGSGYSVRIKPARGASSHPYLRGVFVAPVNLDDLDEFGEDSFYEDEAAREEAEDELREGYDPTVEDDPADDVDDSQTGVDPDVVVEDPDDPEVKLDIVNHHWTIDDESHAIHVKSRKVGVLITSTELRKKTGDGAVAITFPYGKGRVMHVLSHFGKQESTQDTATIENLLVNWLMEIRIFIQ